MERVAIVGVGYTSFSSMTPDVSFQEMIFEAAVKAYEDAGVDPVRDVGSFVSCAEDYLEGYSIFDEFVPDQLGGLLKPVCTVSADGIFGLITAYMHIASGLVDIAVVEAHSKASDLLTYDGVLTFALDPIFHRPLKIHPHALAGMEMNRYLCETGTTEEQCAMVVAQNKYNALDNPLAVYGANIGVEEVLESKVVFYPLKELEISPLADGAIVMVLASEQKAKELTDTPIWINGVGWCSDTPQLECRDWSDAIYACLAAEMAYRMAGIRTPSREVDLAEVDDRFAYKQLQHMEALRLCGRGEAGALVEEGMTARDGDLPVNVSGGSLGVGYLLEACGLHKVLELVLQLRGEAGKRQVPDAEVGLAQCWRGFPTATGAVVILSREGGKP